MPAIFLVTTTVLLTGCDQTVPLAYRDRSEAAAEKLFARGWLPQIIPTSSRAISMENDLDLNTSTGEFEFDAVDHDGFVSYLTRTPSEDREQFSAYSYEGWTFWIAPDKRHCRFRMAGGEAKIEQIRRGRTTPHEETKSSQKDGKVLIEEQGEWKSE